MRIEVGIMGSLARLSLVMLVLLVVATSALADKSPPQEAEVDYIELAALMLRDGHLDRAEATLRQVDLSAEGIDRARFFSLRGLLRLQQKAYGKARDDFKKAIQLGKTEPVVHRYLAQAYFGAEQYAECVRELERAGKAVEGLPSAYLMWAEAHFKLGQTERGFRVLAVARTRHPRERAVQRAHIFRLVDHGLYQQAIDAGESYLEGAQEAADFVALGEALRRSHQPHQAQRVLERARLRFPADRQAVLALTHVYVDQGQYLAGAMLLERLARMDADLALEAAELYRRAGRLERALLWNARVPDQQEKLRQRVSILVQMERYGMVASMEPRLSRLELLEEDDVRYALAYGYFKLGDFDSTEKHLRKLKTAEMFERANQLRRAIQSCKEQGWQCT